MGMEIIWEIICIISFQNLCIFSFPDTMEEGAFMSLTFHTSVWNVRIKFIQFYWGDIGPHYPVVLYQLKSRVN